MKKLAISILAAGLAALTLISCGGEAADSTSTSGSGVDPAGTTAVTTSGTTVGTTPDTIPGTTADTTAQTPSETDTPPTEITTATAAESTPVPSEPDASFGNLIYTIECDITIVDGNAGIAFSGLSNRDFLMWQLAIGEYDDGNLYLRPHYWMNGAASCFEEIVLNEQEGLENISTEPGVAHHMTIRVSDTGMIETLINGVSVYTTDFVYDLVLTDEVGLVGFRCAAYNGGNTPEIGLFDNLKITGAAGEVIYEDDFSDGSSPLCEALVDGNQAVLQDGALLITGSLQGYVGLVDVG